MSVHTIVMDDNYRSFKRFVARGDGWAWALLSDDSWVRCRYRHGSYVFENYVVDLAELDKLNALLNLVP